MQWVRERDAQLEELKGDDGFRTREDFLALMARADWDASRQVDPLEDALAASGEQPGIEALRELALHQADFSFNADMLLVMACARLLGRAPQLETWLKIRKVMYHSSPVEHWLSAAIDAYICKEPGARQAYVDFAVRLFSALESGELKSESKRKGEEREIGLARWQRAEYKLEEIWWGLRGFDFMNYEEEMRIFGLLYEIAPAEFLQLICNSSNPFLVDAALLSAGVGAFSPRFARWEACVMAAPPAFEQDGSWQGSVLLPLLLVRARDELLEPGRRIPRYDADEAQVATVTAEVVALIDVVVNILASRQDAPAAFARWSVWLMRQMLGQQGEDFSDARSAAFVDNALVEAMGKAMKGRSLGVLDAQDAATWEAWCHRCVQSLLAHIGLGGMPSFEGFACQWQLTPEDWFESKGRGLLERAKLHLSGSGSDIPGLSSNLLALPLASTDGFASGWQHLWDDAYYLREVLEFGSVDAGAGKHSDRTDAGRLLLLLLCMGLACFDQATARLKASSPEHASKEVISLHGALASAAWEVEQLDDTINRERWKTFLQHLALRRAVWDGRYAGGRRAALFSAQDGPTIADYLSYFRVDPGDLVTLLHAFMANQVDVSALRDDLRNASVDLGECLMTLRRLHDLRDRAYPMNLQAIKAIEPLIDQGEFSRQ